METKVILKSCVALACAALLVQAQTGPPVTITPFSATGVSFSAYDPAASPAFARFVQNHPEIEPLLPYSAILTNSSSKSIAVLTVRWSCVDLPGGPEIGCLVFRNDGLFIVRTPAAPAGSRILVAPGGTWREDWADRYPPNPMAAQRRSEGAAKRFGSRAAVSVAVDSVIFDDGLVVGPDESGTVDRLKARKQAAEKILGAVMPVLQSGGDPTGLLKDFSDQGAALGGELGHWYSEIARLLLPHVDQPGPRFRALIDELSRMPDVSNLHRNQ